MKIYFRFLLAFLALSMPLTFESCSKDEENPSNPEENGAPDSGDGDNVFTDGSISFRGVPSDLIGGPTSYGANLYYGYPDQITTGYLYPLNEAIFAQFPINYGNTLDASFHPVWGYSYFQGGLAVSDWHDMNDDSYLNQLSVYHPLSPSGGNFIVAYGYATDSNYTPITDPYNATLDDYADCGRIYITDKEGYTVKNPGEENSSVSGKDNLALFKSVEMMNTTYVYKSMENGNGFAQPLNEENKGWLKVQFIAFKDNNPDSKMVGFVEAYLANFDPSLKNEAGFCGKILDDWTKVDLSSLPEASILVVNFVGSDSSPYGLNTPTYCALDAFVIAVEN